MSAVVVQNISKTYGKEKLLAVDGVSFSVNEGEIFGLIGPDGAGKTSIFRILTTLLLPDSGVASVNGFDTVKEYRKIRNQVGYMPGRFSLYQDMSVEENLNFFATVFNTTIEENYYLVEDIYKQLEPFRTRKAGNLSGGMKQKLALCCALIHKPTVLFLDEPTTGVDPVSRKEFWEMLKRLKVQGITIVVATPYMDEANLCDRIALIQNGKILSIDTPKAIAASYPDKLYAVKADKMSNMIKALNQYEHALSCYGFGEFAHVSVDKKLKGEVKAMKSYLEQHGLNDIEIEAIDASIEDCFIKLLS
ncbi:MAG: ABC transporter ATP-binding protein [Lewinellaceae bacterium]|nr:ABC transporter ATP-binding protein [Saprospiraceae bacterium]MCB9343585.1 ABC transporter ATP-binding protein [Lewinellaceae bacterium]